MIADQAFLDQLILNQRRAVRYYLIFAASMVILGFLIILGTFLWSAMLQTDILKALLGLGGAFISTLSAIPIKELLSRKEKIGIFQALRPHLGILDSLEASEKQRVENLIWQAIEKTALG